MRHITTGTLLGLAMIAALAGCPSSDDTDTDTDTDTDADTDAVGDAVAHP